MSRKRMVRDGSGGHLSRSGATGCTRPMRRPLEVNQEPRRASRAFRKATIGGVCLIHCTRLGTLQGRGPRAFRTAHRIHRPAPSATAPSQPAHSGSGGRLRATPEVCRTGSRVTPPAASRPSGAKCLVRCAHRIARRAGIRPRRARRPRTVSRP